MQWQAWSIPLPRFDMRKNNMYSRSCTEFCDSKTASSRLPMEMLAACVAAYEIRKMIKYCSEGLERRKRQCCLLNRYRGAGREDRTIALLMTMTSDKQSRAHSNTVHIHELGAKGKWNEGINNTEKKDTWTCTYTCPSCDLFECSVKLKLSKSKKGKAKKKRLSIQAAICRKAVIFEKLPLCSPAGLADRPYWRSNRILNKIAIPWPPWRPGFQTVL